MKLRKEYKDVARQKTMIFSEVSEVDLSGAGFFQDQHKLRREIMEVWIRTLVLWMDRIGRVLEVLCRKNCKS